MSMRLTTIAIGLLSALAFAAPSRAQSAGGDDAAAHALADKFSGEAEAKRKAEAWKKTAEEKAIALERQRALEARRREAAAKAAEVQRRKVEAERQAAERARAEEAEMLARARREAAEREEVQRKAREVQEQAAKARAESEERERAERARLEAERVARDAAAAEARRAEAARRVEDERIARETEERRREDDRREMEAKREAEARELAEKHKRLREEREAETARKPAEDPPVVPVAPETDVARPYETNPHEAAPREPAPGASGPYAHGREPDRPRDAVRSAPTPVTVLLIMEPGNRGIRRYGKTADPVLCSGPDCWVSKGPGEASLKMPRRTALGSANTLGRRAWACRQSLGCVFRNIEFGSASVLLQPVDLRLMRHDRREWGAASADSTCEVTGGRLYCGQPVLGKTWRAWMVPESVAIEAGERLLSEALASGLPETRYAGWRR